MYRLWMQTNGNLELHKQQIDEWRIIWASRTSGAGDPPYLLGLKQSNNKLKIKLKLKLELTLKLV